MRTKPIPQNTATAVATLLQPFVPELTPSSLTRALREFDPTPKGEGPAVGASMTLAEFCRRAGCSRSTAYRLRKEGRLRAFRLGPAGGVRIPETEVLKLMAACGDGCDEGGEAEAIRPLRLSPGNRE